MASWKNIHPDFTKELQKEWVEWGFTLQTAQEWINNGFIKPTDVGYVQWLKNWVWKKPWDINSDTEQNLRKKYEEHLTQRPKSVYCPSDYVKRLLLENESSSSEEETFEEETTTPRNILLIGRTGRGKSALANVVTNTNKFKESDGSTSETRKIQVGEFKENEIIYHIIDTPGIGDTKLADDEVLYTIAEAVYLVKDGVSRVFFVINGRFDQYEMVTYDLLRETIFDQNITNHTTITRTCFNEFRNKGECKTDIGKMIEETKEKKVELEKDIHIKEQKIKNFFPNSSQYRKLFEEIEELRKKLLGTNLAEIIESCQGKIIHIDNSSIDVEDEDELEMNKEDRDDSREILLRHMNENCLGFSYKPPKLRELSDEIVNHMEEKLNLEAKLVRKSLKKEKKAKDLENKDKEGISVRINSQNTSIENSERELENLSTIETEVFNNEKENNESVSKDEIKKLESRVEKLKREIREKEEIIRQKVLDHIFNNYKNIIKLQGGDNLFNSIIGDSNNWLSISKEFNNKKLVGKWLSRGFNYQQTQKLAVDLGNSFNPTDASFYAWLRDNNQLVTEKILNNESIEELKRTYYYQLQKEEAKLEDSHNWRNQQLKPEEIRNIVRHFREEFGKWTSGNSEIDLFIQKHQLEATKPREILEWIPHEQFIDIKYLSQGGFGKVYKAKWINGPIMKWNNENNQWERYKHEIGEVVLKSLNYSQNITTDFLQEIAYHRLIDSSEVVSCYGISQDPITNNYLMVIQYIKEGDLRQYLQNNYSELDFEDKLYQLYTISLGLKQIHDKNLVHRDFHSGNILSDGESCYITDLGLSRPADIEDKEESVYGVLPYIAPEVMLSKSFAQASDIYSFGIVAYEVTSGKPPYYNLSHDAYLATKICEGLRPKFDIKVPLLLDDLVCRCWNADPNQRPTSNELNIILHNWYSDILHQRNTEIYRQIKEAEEFNKTLPSKNNTNSLKFSDPLYYHPSAIYTSRLLSFNNLPKPRNSKEVNEKFYSSSSRIDFDKYKSKEHDFDIITEELSARVKRQLSLSVEIQNNNKSVKLDELVTESMEIDNYNQQAQGFSPQQNQDWINIGLQPTDHQFASYLRDYKNLTPEEVLNKGNYEQLRAEYQTYQEQLAQIEQVPK